MGMPAGVTTGQGGFHPRGAIASGARRRLEPEGLQALVMGPRNPPAGVHNQLNFFFFYFVLESFSKFQIKKADLASFFRTLVSISKEEKLCYEPSMPVVEVARVANPLWATSS